MTGWEPTVGLHDDVPNDVYHAQTDWYGSTQLKTFLPEEYRPFTGDTSPALAFGTLVHEVVLEPDQIGRYEPMDAAVIGVKSDGTPAQNPLMTTAWKRAVAEVEADGRTPVAQDDWDRAHAMRDALAAHPEAGPLLFGPGGTREESAFYVDLLGRRHKARFDRRIPGAIIDLKTTSAQPGAHSLGKAVVSYGYELAAAHYLEVAQGLGCDVDTFLHVWVEKVAPYRVTVTELDSYFLMRGLQLRDLALNRAHGLAEPYDGATGRLLLACPGWASPDDEEMVA